jgi:hypothetical protein
MSRLSMLVSFSYFGIIGLHPTVLAYVKCFRMVLDLPSGEKMVVRPKDGVLVSVLGNGQHLSLLS